jgi:hypothetical protein
LATAIQILKGAFGVKSLTPTDPGIVNLAKVRSGNYPVVGNVTITPAQEVAQILGQAPDPLAAATRAGVFDKPSFINDVLPKLLLTTNTAVAGFGIGGTLGPIISGGVNKLAGNFAQGGRPMSFADGDSSGFTLPTFGDLGQILQGQLGQNLLNVGTQALSSFVAQQFNPMQANMAAVPAVVGAGRAVATVGRSFFNKFPNLAVAIQGLRNAGKNVTRANLWSLMKRFGPDFLISGGILTAAAVSELAMAGPGRRRMNPGNVKALRRAHRRMKSFHHVCQTNDHLLAPRRRRSSPANFGGTRITQVK